jgi:choline monooxygenase
MDFLNETTYSKSRLPVEHASTLIADAYRSEGYFASEQNRVFAGGWVAVGATSEVAEPGQVIIRQEAGRSVIITRNQEGQLRAFLNVCRHRGNRLTQDDCILRAGRIRCPYHSWAYDLNGGCIGTPLFEGSDIPDAMRAAFAMENVKAFDRADYPLYSVRTETWGPLLLISLDPDVMPIEEWLGDLTDKLDGYDLEYGVVIERAQLSFEAIAISEFEAELLRVPIGSPAMLERHLAYDTTGRPVDYGYDLYRGDRVRFITDSATLPQDIPEYDRSRLGAPW